MEIKQKTFLEVEKDGKMVQLVVDQTLPLGLLFDALMEFKGYVVERMTQSHKAEEKEAEEKMGSDEGAEKEAE